MSLCILTFPARYFCLPSIASYPFNLSLNVFLNSVKRSSLGGTPVIVLKESIRNLNCYYELIIHRDETHAEKDSLTKL